MKYLLGRTFFYILMLWAFVDRDVTVASALTIYVISVVAIIFLLFREMEKEQL